MKPDNKGWMWHERQRIRIAWFAFEAIDLFYRGMWRVSGTYLPWRAMLLRTLWFR